jgi:hypothetical protein
LAAARTQSQLRIPSDLTDRPGLLLLPEPQFTADPGREVVGPGRLDQRPAGRAVAATSSRTIATPLSPRIVALKEIPGLLRPEPQRERPAPPKVYAPPSKGGWRPRRG